MKDIKVILEAYELDDDMREGIISEVNANYRTINEVNAKAQRISELEEQNRALTEQVGKLEGDGEELDKLKKQVQDFEEAEQSRRAAEEESAKRESFRAMFDAAIGDKEFANDIVRDALFERAYGRCTEQTGLDAKTVIEELTKDTNGIWKNPQQDVSKMPNPNDVSNNKDHAVKSAERTILNFMAGRS